MQKKNPFYKNFEKGFLISGSFYYVCPKLFMRTLVLSTLLLLISGFTFGQNNFKKGFIVKSQGDTIHGYIKEDVEPNLSESVEFKNSEIGTKVFSIVDITGFGFDNENKFRRVNYIDPLDSSKQKTYFAKLLLAGKYELFSLRKKDDDYLYFVVISNDTSYLLYDDKKTPMGEVLEPGNYQNLLYFFGRECQKANSSVDKIIFTEKALISYFASLEKCNGNKNNSVLYYSKPKSQKNIVLEAGGFQLDGESQIFFQGLIQFFLPSISQKTSLNTGIVYLHNKRETVQEYSLGEVKYLEANQIFEVPFFVQYNILNKGVRPYIFGGAGLALKGEKGSTGRLPQEYRQSFGVTIIGGGGVDVKAVRNLYLKFEGRFDALTRLPVIGIGISFRK